MSDGDAQRPMSRGLAVIKRGNAVAAHHGLQDLTEVLRREEPRVAAATREANRMRMVEGAQHLFRPYTSGLAAGLLERVLPQRPRGAGLVLWQRLDLGDRQHVRAAANAGVDQPLGLELLVGTLDRDAVYAEALGQGAAGWQARACSQVAG